MASLQESQGRQGRNITDQDAREISRVEELSYDLKISDVMTSEVRSVNPEMRLANVLEILRIARISGVPVQENGLLVGVLSIEDIVRAMEKNELTAPVSKYMSSRVVSVSLYDPVVKALETFGEFHV